MLRSEHALRPYQCRAVNQVVKKARTALFIDMGLGKTIIALTAIADIKALKPGFKWLVIAPIKVAETVWRQEAQIWEHTQDITFSLVRGNPRERAFALSKEADVYLINPELIKWLHQYLREDWSMFDGLIIDESSLFKDHRSKRFKTLTNYQTQKALKGPDGKALRDERGQTIKIPPHKFKRTVIMTGTPRPNSMLNLWSQIFILDHGKRLHPKFEYFRERFFAPTFEVAPRQMQYEEKDKLAEDYVPVEGAPKKVHELIADISVELDADEYGVLPKILPLYHMVRMPLDLKKRYDELEREALIELSENTLIAQNGGVRTMMCWQFANGALYTGLEKERIRQWEPIHDLMLDELDDLIARLDRNVLIAYQFKHDLARILKRHPDAVPLPRKAERVVEAWNKGHIGKLLLHPKSGSHGLNIQFGGSDVIWFGSLWSNEQYRQTNRRLARPGQKCGEGVTAHHIQVAGTIHELQHASIMEKGSDEDRFRQALRKYQRAKNFGLYMHELYDEQF